MAWPYQLGKFDLDITVKNLNDNNLNIFNNIMTDVFTVLNCSENDNEECSYICTSNVEYIIKDIKQEYENAKNNDEQKLCFEEFEYEYVPEYDKYEEIFCAMPKDWFLKDIETRINALIKRLKDTDIVYVSHEVSNIHFDDYDTMQYRYSNDYHFEHMYDDEDY